MIRCNLVAILIIAASVPLVQSLLNGKTAIPHSHPWLLSFNSRDLLWRLWGDGQICGATLIRVPYLENASDIALTAAHCLDERGRWWFDHIEFVVHASDHDQEETDQGEVIVEVAHCIRHPKYDPSIHYQHDIAVLKLARPLEFTETIKPIKLPGEGEEILREFECTVAGWGATKLRALSKNGAKRSTEGSRFLQQIPVGPIASSVQISSSICSDYEPNVEICSRITYGRSPYDGDSGSPLICIRANESVLFGITSYIHLPGGVPSDCTFVKVESYNGWIQKQIEGLNRSRLYRRRLSELAANVDVIFALYFLVFWFLAVN